MDLDQLLRHYFGTDDPHDAALSVQGRAHEAIAIDFGVERDPARRFALWSLMDALGFAPVPAEAFAKEPALRAAAERYLDAAYRIEREHG
ncbi:hypothetical protein [Sphingomonas sp. VNH70]|uniref:hypothetical protein n=1 Tax=Sphingomonas silueang TaxID=3156617 RepID=UPI0032B5304C